MMMLLLLLLQVLVDALNGRSCRRERDWFTDLQQHIVYAFSLFIYIPPSMDQNLFFSGSLIRFCNEK
jgi:hypothetical protein